MKHAKYYFGITIALILASIAYAQTTTITNVDVSWTPPTKDEQGFDLNPAELTYALYRKNASTGAEEYITTFPAGDKGSARLPVGQHNLYLRAIKGALKSAPSNTVSVTIAPASPGAPGAVQATVRFTVKSQ
jgi:hypothetical protein